MELQPINVALISVPIKSEAGQKTVSHLERANLGACTTIDLSAALDFSRDEASLSENRCGRQVDVQRIVMSHRDFVSIVVECLKGSITNPAGRFRAHLRVDMGGIISDVVCRAEQEFLNAMTVEHEG